MLCLSTVAEDFVAQGFEKMGFESVKTTHSLVSKQLAAPFRLTLSQSHDKGLRVHIPYIYIYTLYEKGLWFLYIYIYV